VPSGNHEHKNTATSPQDLAAYIRELLNDIRKEKAHIRGRLQAFEQRTEELDRRHNLFQPMVSLIHLVPLEVLGEAFVQALDNYKRQTTLVRLSQVCKTWRQAAHLVPRFWQCPTLDLSRTLLSYEEVGPWVTRSKDLPKKL
jgi:hypothetical protein